MLAYSTISQLGYMVMALGVGAWTAAVFHLFTHAFFKALLFLGAGSVSHSGSHHSFDMKDDMGGLRKSMPITFWTFMIGTLALAGHLPARRLLVEGRDPRHRGPERLRGRSWSSGLIGAFLTAAYMTRCVYLTFFGEYRGHGHPHESREGDHVPLIILAVLSVVAGFLNAAPFGIEKFTEWVEPTVRVPDLVAPRVRLHAARRSRWSSPRSGSASRRSSGSSARSSARSRASPSATGSRTPGYTFLENKYYLDDLYEERHRRRRSRARSRAASTGSTRT